MQEIIQLGVGGAVALLITKEVLKFAHSIRKNGRNVFSEADRELLKNLSASLVEDEKSSAAYRQELLYEVKRGREETVQILNKLYDVLVEQRPRQ